VTEAALGLLFSPIVITANKKKQGGCPAVKGEDCLPTPFPFCAIQDKVLIIRTAQTHLYEEGNWMLLQWKDLAPVCPWAGTELLRWFKHPNSNTLKCQADIPVGLLLGPLL